MHTQLLSFCIATLCYWLQNLLQIYQPNYQQIKRKIQTNHDFHINAFLHLVLASCSFASNSEWSMGLSVSVAIGLVSVRE